MLKSKLYPTLLFILLFLLIIYPTILGLYIKGIEIPFKFFAADSFYYLTIAARSSSTNLYTFDGIFPTNGFHPLWQYYLTISFKLFHLQSQEIQIYFVFLSTIIFTAVGTSLFGLSLYHLSNNFALSLLGGVPGFYYILFCNLNPHYFSPWSFINGMESGLSILFFGILSYLLFNKEFLNKYNYIRILSISFFLSLICLSRLDDIFLTISFLIIFYISNKNDKKIFTYISLLAFFPVFLVAIYIIYNFYYAHMLLPVSGTTKGGFSLIKNIGAFINIFIPFRYFMKTSTGYRTDWQDVSWRALQMGIPLLVSLIALLYITLKKKISITNLKENEKYQTFLIYTYCIYVSLKGSYNIINVSPYHQGHWYFPLSIMVFNLIITMCIHSIFKNCNISEETYSIKIIKSNNLTKLVPLTLLIYIIFISNSFLNYKINSSYNYQYYNFWKNRNEILHNLQSIYPENKILEFDDGIIAYSLGLKTMSGLGFALDQEAFIAKNKGRLLDISYNRGIHVLCSMNYITIPNKACDNRELLKETLSKIFFMKNQNIERWNFRVIYLNKETGVIFIEFFPVN